MEKSNLFKTKGCATVLFTATLLTFFIAKYPILSTPFFWDELGVYGSMAFHLASTGPSLMPGAVDQWHSHGHPLLYPFVVSMMCKWFGINLFVAHLTNVLIAMSLVFFVFIHVSRSYNHTIGVFTAILLCVQPIFFTQAAMILPEIMLGLLLWLTTWCYFKRKIGWYLLSGSAAVLVKEPAIVWITTIAVYDFFNGHKRFTWRSIKWLCPLIVFGLFLLKQKATWGFYLFPYHCHSLNLNPILVWDKLIFHLKFLFWDQGRWTILTILILAVISIIRKERVRTVFKTLWREHSYTFLGVCLCGSYLLFCSLTFMGTRYLLPLLPFTVLFGSLAIYRMRKYSLRVSLISAAICTVVPLFYMTSKTFSHDNDMSYLRAIKAQRIALEYMIRNNIYEEGKFSVNMPLVYATLDHRYGFLPDSLDPLSSHPISERIKFAVALSPGTSLENPNNYPLTLMHEEYIHDIKLSVYRVEHDTIQ